MFTIRIISTWRTQRFVRMLCLPPGNPVKFQQVDDDKNNTHRHLRLHRRTLMLLSSSFRRPLPVVLARRPFHCCCREACAARLVVLRMQKTPLQQAAPGVGTCT